MTVCRIDKAELRAQKAALQQRIESYKQSLNALHGACSRSSVRKQIEECEMRLEQVQSELGEL